MRKSVLGISLLVATAMAFGVFGPAPQPEEQAFGFGKPQHSKVSVATDNAKGNLEFTFKIEPNSDMSVTFDAPWALEIKNAAGLSFSSQKLKKSDLDQKIPGFKVSTSAAPAADKGELEYKLTSFICTKDKTRCYREVHKGKHNWAKK